MTKVYNKLVRDKIPEIMIKNGVVPVTRVLNDDEYLEELNKKLQEEVNEYLVDGAVEELADIQEVLLAILAVKKIPYNDFEKVRQEKLLKRGAFQNKIFLEKEE